MTPKSNSAQHFQGATLLLLCEPIFFLVCSNNNISRIGQMLEALRTKYGKPIGSMEDGDDRQYYEFPTPEVLASAAQPDLRALGLGYRDKFVIGTAKKLLELGGRPYFDTLRELGSQGKAQEVQQALMQFDGVGAKVADCVALFSCNTPSAIPVDTHVWAIACCYYDPALQQAKSLTPTVYKRVGDLFRQRFGDHAGWAHSLLFAGEISAFKSRLPASLREQMDAFKAQEKEKKAATKKEAAERKQNKKKAVEEGKQAATAADEAVPVDGAAKAVTAAKSTEAPPVSGKKRKREAKAKAAGAGEDAAAAGSAASKK
jgi:HhH-GPD superfamily base excision DNA repair protein